MKHKSEAIIVGWIRKGRPADCGETMKNQLMIQKLEQLGVHCHQMDFKDWRKHPWTFLQLAWNMTMHRDATLVFSTSVCNVINMMKLLRFIGWKQHTVHWVIGGQLGRETKNGVYDVKALSYMDWTLIEGKADGEILSDMGVKNVLQVANFKPITYLPDISQKQWGKGTEDSPLRFVFLSRIIAAKGCDYIMEAARQLNEMGYGKRYKVDFYGPISNAYRKVFEDKIAMIDNVCYAGFLNLREHAGYDKLAEYDAMLFPTYWEGEGCAGVFIDTLIAGVPMLLTDWQGNREFMTDGQTARFFPVHDVIALCDTMRDAIEGRINLAMMGIECQKASARYDIDNVVTRKLLQKIGLLNDE